MDPTLKIRQATNADAAKLHELHTNSVKELCKAHYTAAQIDGWLAHRSPAGYKPGIQRGEMFIAERDEQVVGFGHALRGEVLAIFVAPEWAGQGVGSTLLTHAVKVAGGDSKAVRVEATLNAQSFYARSGFVALEQKFVQRNHVQLPVVVMELMP